jgi:hypothetical protein
VVAQSPGPQQAVPPAPADVQAFVREALHERLDANQVPDVDVSAASTRVAIREEMPAAHMKLTSDALPHRDGVVFYLLSTAAAQAQADRTRIDVFFLIVDSPHIDGGTASLQIGSDIVIHHDPSRQIIKMCCCEDRAKFRRSTTSGFSRAG